MIGWFVAETQPRAELLAKEHLARQDFSTYRPRFWKLRRHAPKAEHVMHPLFSGDIFVSFDPARHPWRSANGTRMARRFLMLDVSTPRPAPPSVFEEIKSRSSDELVVRELVELRPGASAKIVSGPLANREVQIDTLDDRERVRSLFTLLGREAGVVVSLCCLESVQ